MRLPGLTPGRSHLPCMALMRPWLTMRWCGLLAGYLLGAAGKAGSRTTGAAVAAGPLFH